MKTILALFGSACVFANSASAQSYSIDWFTIDGGVGTSTGGVYSVSGTIGQPDAGVGGGGIIHSSRLRARCFPCSRRAQRPCSSRISRAAA
jgi:hypothetical protein